MASPRLRIRCNEAGSNTSSPTSTALVFGVEEGRTRTISPHLSRSRALDAGRVRSRKIRCSICDEPLSPGSARHAVRLGSRLVDAVGSIDDNTPVFSLRVRMNKNAKEAFHSPASQGGTTADSCGGGDRDENTSWREMAGAGNDTSGRPVGQWPE